MNEIIRVENASYDYDVGDSPVRGVRGVSLSIGEGEFIVLLGRNGSGKSTLAKLLNGFFEPSSGDVTVAGINTKDGENIFEIRRRVGMVFQNPDNQTVASIVEDDLAFGPENLGVPREEIGRRIEWALDTVGMTEYRKASPSRLSGGQKQRIAIAAILAMKPEILILDESTAMLDPKGRAEVMQTIKKLNAEKMTIILITHYMDEAVGADRIVVLDDGEIVLEGSPREVFSETEKIRKAKLEIPVASAAAEELIRAGYPINFALTDEELAGELCRLK